MHATSFKISGLHCSEEIALLKSVLGKEKAIKELQFDLIGEKMTATYDEQLIDSKRIIEIVNATGMKATLFSAEEKKLSFWGKHGRALLTALSGFFLVSGVTSQFLASEKSVGLYFLAIASGVIFVLPKAWQALKRLRPDMNLLMVIAISGAIGIDEWFEAASVTFLFSVALLLEHWSLGRARRAISALLELAPPFARIISKDGSHMEEKPTSEVVIGDEILIKPGEKVPLDGIVTEGTTSINQAPITGESIPVLKEVGDEVFAGTINEEGAIRCRVEKVATDSTLSRIIKMVSEAGKKRARSEQWVERFAKYYTPAMILFAATVLLIPPLLFGEAWDPWIYRSLVILVIACPCALVISTPVSIVSALTASARNGVLVKGGLFMEMPAHLKVVAMDKTGTLTLGQPAIQKIIPLNGHTEEELLERAAALEKPSEHPLARAIVKCAEERDIKVRAAEDFSIVKGKGASGCFRGTKYWIGSHRFMHEMGQETDEIHQMALDLEDAGHSVVAIGNDKHICGLLSIADQVRPDSAATVQAMKATGIKKVVMLTGDNAPTARALAAEVAVDEHYAELLPEDKVAAVEKLVKDYGEVAMIGDGINDAPAMAVSSLGIAMGAMGTDAAIETADVALMSDELSKVPWLIRKSRRTLKIIKQNIVFSLALKTLFLGLALFGLASLWLAIAADTGAALIVVSNGLRLLKRD